MNKAKQVRQLLNLTPAQAGVLLLGKTNKKSAYDQWTQWENGRGMSTQTEKLFDLIIRLDNAIKNDQITKQNIFEYILKI